MLDDFAYDIVSGYRNFQCLSNALLFFSRRFERISFFFQKTSGYDSSVGYLPAIKPYPYPPPTRTMVAAADAAAGGRGVCIEKMIA